MLALLLAKVSLILLCLDKKSNKVVKFCVHISTVFKPGAPGFLKFALCGHWYVCVFVRVSAPEAVNN